MTEQELVEKVAKAIMQDDCCGLTLETKERVFCDDERLPKDTRYKTDECKCKSGARAALSVIREALREPSEEMQNALIGAVRDGIAINDELAQRIAKETGAYYNQAQRALCVISEAGYDLVPRKLTMDMIVAGAEAVLIGGVPEEMSQRSYRAMIAASPIGKK